MWLHRPPLRHSLSQPRSASILQPSYTPPSLSRDANPHRCVAATFFFYQLLFSSRPPHRSLHNWERGRESSPVRGKSYRIDEKQWKQFSVINRETMLTDYSWKGFGMTNCLLPFVASSCKQALKNWYIYITCMIIYTKNFFISLSIFFITDKNSSVDTWSFLHTCFYKLNIE